MLAAPPPLPAAIAFRDPSRGALTTANGRVEVTTDGGRTWRFAAGRGPAATRARRESPCRGQLFEGFTSGPWALCVGEGGAGAMGKAVYRRTKDGWRLLARTPFPPPGPPRGGLSITGYPVGISMAPDGFGVIWESRGTLYVTRDGGAHWLGLPRLAAPDVDFGVSGSALPHGVAFVLLLRGGLHERLLETTDAGRTWRVVHRWG